MFVNLLILFNSRFHSRKWKKHRLCQTVHFHWDGSFIFSHNK